MPLNQERQKVLKSAIPFILQNGWDPISLELASESLGKEKNYYLTLFPTLSSAVEFFEEQEDIRMIQNLQQKEIPQKIRTRIKRALLERITHISGGKKMLKELEAFYLNKKHPLECTPAILHIWRTSDAIWKYAGDQSLDFNYYTKRTLLSGVYAKVVRHYLRIESEDIEEFTITALDKAIQLGNIKKFFKIPKIEDIPILRMFS